MNLNGFNVVQSPIKDLAGTPYQEQFKDGLGIHLVAGGELPTDLGDVIENDRDNTIEALLRKYHFMVLDNVVDFNVSRHAQVVYRDIPVDRDLLGNWHHDNGAGTALSSQAIFDTTRIVYELPKIQTYDGVIAIYYPQQRLARTVPTLVAPKSIIADAILTAADTIYPDMRAACAAIAKTFEDCDLNSTPRVRDYLKEKLIDAAAFHSFIVLDSNTTSCHRPYGNKINDEVTKLSADVTCRVDWKPNRALLFDNLHCAHRRGPLDGAVPYLQGRITNYNIKPYSQRVSR